MMSQSKYNMVGEGKCEPMNKMYSTNCDNILTGIKLESFESQIRPQGRFSLKEQLAGPELTDSTLVADKISDKKKKIKIQKKLNKKENQIKITKYEKGYKKEKITKKYKKSKKYKNTKKDKKIKKNKKMTKIKKDKISYTAAYLVTKRKKLRKRRKDKRRRSVQLLVWIGLMSLFCPKVGQRMPDWKMEKSSGEDKELEIRLTRNMGTIATNRSPVVHPLGRTKSIDQKGKCKFMNCDVVLWKMTQKLRNKRTRCTNGNIGGVVRGAPIGVRRGGGGGRGTIFGASPVNYQFAAGG